LIEIETLRQASRYWYGRDRKEPCAIYRDGTDIVLGRALGYRCAFGTYLDAQAISSAGAQASTPIIYWIG